jgi:hypothetical protein
VADREGIEVTAEELDRRIDSIAIGAGNQADELRKQMNTPEQRERLEYGLRIEKAVDLLVSTAQITHKEVDPPAALSREEQEAAAGAQAPAEQETAETEAPARQEAAGTEATHEEEAAAEAE